MDKKSIYSEVQDLEPVCMDICRTVWENPEQSGSEQKCPAYLADLLREEGFRITVDENVPNAFIAEYGSSRPCIAIIGEYDALPGLSQKAGCTAREAVTEGGPGHGCGHNLLGAGAATAAIAVRRFLEKSGNAGTVRFYGCPEEELLQGKVKMAYYHMFDGCDAAITWHPGVANMAHDRAYLANVSAHYYFTGKSSHAAFAPELGRSALDAVELMSVGANYLREHVIDFTRIHYTTDSGGFAPNIVPSQASAWYYIRAPHQEDVQSTLKRLNKVAQGAALMTETDVRIEEGTSCSEFVENTSFADIAYENLTEAPRPSYTKAELDFARKLQGTLDPASLTAARDQYGIDLMADGVSPRGLWESCEMKSSSDSGDLSRMMPSCVFTTACWPVGVAYHTWQVTAAGGTSLGSKGALYAAMAAAGIAYDLLTEPDKLERITEEFHQRNSEEYIPLYKES